MSSSAVKTRNMTSAVKLTDPKQGTQTGMNSMDRYLKKAVPEQTTKQKVSPTPQQNKTPKRRQKQKKTETQRNSPRTTQDKVDTENDESNSEREVFSDSEAGGENDTIENETGNLYNNLEELENEVDVELDPRTINLSPDTHPLIMLSLLKKVECLEREQQVLREENDSLKTSLNFNIEKVNDLENDVKTYRKEMEATQININNVKASNTILKEENAKIKEKTLKAESYSRRNNLRFDGIIQDQNETSDNCREIIYSILKHELGIHDAESRIIIDRCHRDPRYPNTNPASILVRFLSYRDRDEVWQRREHLNKNQRNRLFVNEDFPPEVEKKRAFLRPYLKAAYKSGRKAVLVGDQLLVDGLKYSVDELDKLPSDMGPDKIAIRRENNTTLFYRSDAFLSNFHKAEMSIGGVEYSCVEQYFTAEKACMFNDLNAIDKIMKTDNPSEMKYHGRNVRSFNQKQWDEKASSVMIAGLRAKFCQNERLKVKLLDTNESELAEASRFDKTWGIGMSIHDPKSPFKENWQGRNQLGNLLMKVRDDLRKNRL